MDTKCVYVKDHYVVQNLELCYGGKGIQTAGEGTIIRNNHVHDVYATGIGLYTAWGCEVSSNLVERTGYTQIYVQYGGNNWVHHNVCRYTGIDRNFTGTIIASNCFVPIIENANIGIQQGTNNLIEWNTLSHSWSDFIDWYYESGTTVRYNYGYFSGMATAPYGNGIKMHHNIFHMGGHGSGISAFYGYDTNYCSGPDLGTNWIFNNLVYDYTTSGLYTRDNSPKVQFRNNILVSGFANKNLVNISPGTGSDYNIFWCKAGNPLGWVLGDTNVSPTLELWKARSGQDTHSIYADPQFVSADPVTAADFQLKKTSPCIDVGWDPQGTGFSPSAQGYQDYLGTRISQGLGPDIGAFEYKAAALTAPAAPPNLRIPNR